MCIPDIFNMHLEADRASGVNKKLIIQKDIIIQNYTKRNQQTWYTATEYARVYNENSMKQDQWQASPECDLACS